MAAPFIFSQANWRQLQQNDRVSNNIIPTEMTLNLSCKHEN